MTTSGFAPKLVKWYTVSEYLFSSVVYKYEPGTGYSAWEKELLKAGFTVLQSTHSARLLGNAPADNNVKSNGDGSVTIAWTTYILYQNFENCQRIIINLEGKSELEGYIKPAENTKSPKQSGNGNGGGTSGSTGDNSGGSGYEYNYDTNIEMDYGTDFYNPYENDYKSDSGYDSGTDTWWDDDVWDYNPYGSSDSYDDNHYDSDGDNDGWW